MQLLGAGVLVASGASPRILIRADNKLLMECLMLEAGVHPVGHGVSRLLKYTNLVDVVWQFVAQSDATIDHQRVGTLAGQGIVSCGWLIM